MTVVPVAMSRTVDLGFPCSMFNNCVADILEIARTTKPVSIRVALKSLKLTYTDNMRRRRFYDGINILCALKVVPAVTTYKKRNSQASMTKYTETLYDHVHRYPGPYVPAALCEMLSVDRRRTYDVFAVLRAMGLVYRGEKHYGLISDLDDKASYWWSLLCDAWGNVNRDALIQAQVINLKYTLIARCERREGEPLTGNATTISASSWTQGKQQELEGNVTHMPYNSWMLAPKLWFHDISELQKATATVPDGILQEYSPVDHYAGEDQLAAIMRESDIPMYDQLCLPESDGPMYDHMCVSETVEQTFEYIVQSL